MRPMKTVVFDIDGTLADVRWRRHFVEGSPKDFDSFYEAMDGDGPRVEIVELCRMYFNAGWYVLIFTGRPESYREKTESWLEKNNIPYYELHMRPYNMRYEADHIVKQKMLNNIDRPVNVAVDDRQKVVEMWRNNGIVCLQCDDGDF